MKHSRNGILLSLRKARGTIDKVIEMTENDTYCADVAHQINATMGLLKSANRELLRDHLHCCGKDTFTTGSEKDIDSFIDELLRVWDVATRK